MIRRQVTERHRCKIYQQTKQTLVLATLNSNRRAHLQLVQAVLQGQVQFAVVLLERNVPKMVDQRHDRCVRRRRGESVQPILVVYANQPIVAALPALPTTAKKWKSGTCIYTTYSKLVFRRTCCRRTSGLKSLRTCQLEVKSVNSFRENSLLTVCQKPDLTRTCTIRT